MDRRSFITIAATTLVASGQLSSIGKADQSRPIADRRPYRLYASLGTKLVQVDLSALGVAGTTVSDVSLPASVQFASFHPSSRYLYVATSTAGPGGMTGNEHYLNAFSIDEKTGNLWPIGTTITLPYRPIHTLVDERGKFLIVAFPAPGTLQVFAIDNDGLLGPAIQQPTPIVGGVFVHQVRMLPSGRTVFLVARGFDATPSKPEELGAFTTFDFKAGVLVPASYRVLSPETGPRSIDFHPKLPLAYVALERGNALHVYRIQDERLSDKPVWTKEVLQNLEYKKRARQRVGAGIVHPDGRFFYTVNRADKTADIDGKKVFAGGENNIAVYALDDKTGEPSLIQHLPCEGVEPRTLEFVDGGTTLLVGNQTEMRMPDGTVTRPNVAFFTIGGDGRLTFSHKYEFDAGPQGLVWMGTVALLA